MRVFYLKYLITTINLIIIKKKKDSCYEKSIFDFIIYKNYCIIFLNLVFHDNKMYQLLVFLMYHIQVFD